MVCNAVEKEFKFWMPLEVTKSSKGDMRIGGIATDENAPDLQGEKVFVRGLDTSYLTNRGVFNWNHGKEPGDILGEIDIAQKNFDKGTLYVEGFLYPGVKKAIDTYDLMRSLKDSGSDRKLGLSVEGKVKERDIETGKQIKKAWIRAVAITYDPINQGAFVDMIKSFGNFTFEPCKGECSKCTFGDCPEDTKKSDIDPRDELPEVATPLIDPRDPIPGPDNVCSKCGKYKTGAASDEICMCDMPVAMAIPDGQVYAGATEKAISAGHDIPATSGGVSGSALRDEELEKDPKVTTYDERHFKENKKRKKMFTKSEVTDLLKEKGIEGAELFTDCIFKSLEIQEGGIRSIVARLTAEGKVKGHLRRTRKGTTGWVKPHSRMAKEDQQYKRTLESAVGPWLDARDAGEQKPFAAWIKEKDPKTYKKLIGGIGKGNIHNFYDHTEAGN
jgi:hypothetical protein